MITETDQAIYDRLDSISHYGRNIPVRFFGAEKEYAKNLRWSTDRPYYCVQRYDMSFGWDRWSPDDETIEFNYSNGTARIKAPDFPFYLFYQVDCMATKQRDLGYLLSNLIPAMPNEGYLTINAYGRDHTHAFVLVDSVELSEHEETHVWRHALRYRIDIRIKNLTEREAYLVIQRILREYDITGTYKKRELTIT